MSLIKSSIKEVTGWIEFPGIKNFKVQLRFLNREDLQKIRNNSLTTKINKRTRQREEEIDNDKFLVEYASRVIMDWSGLTMGDLPKLVPAEISKEDSNKPVPFSDEEALALLQNSSEFDQFITDELSDFEQFSKDRVEQNSKN